MQKAENKHQVPGHGNHDSVVIHFGNRQERSPNPTTGTALYNLWGVNSETHDLYKEIPGRGDDLLIQNNSSSITLKNGDHFYSAQKTLNPGSI